MLVLFWVWFLGYLGILWARGGWCNICFVLVGVCWFGFCGIWVVWLWWLFGVGLSEWVGVFLGGWGLVVLGGFLVSIC